MSAPDQFDAFLNTVQEVSVDQPVPCGRLIGAAGTGKTYQLLARTGADPTYGLLTATTGISAVNLGAVTMHSTLRYSTTEVLRDSYLTGQLTRILHGVAKRARRLIVEEYSMADADQLDLWYRGVQEVNRYGDCEPLGILLVGDLAQLPPVKARWCFEATCWRHFAENTERLEKVYRQGGGPFLDALNRLREGDGAGAVDILCAAGVSWETVVDTEFDGTTILPKNQSVNRYNALGLDRLRTPAFRVATRRWGKQQREWDWHPRTREWGIPPQQEFKDGAQVVILANRPDFSVVNGDGGHVVSHDKTSVTVHVTRTGADETINKIVRACGQSDEPHDWDTDLETSDNEWCPEPHYCSRTRQYVLGQIEYLPVKLAYASTVHKSQSLTLDKVQCDFRDQFFGQPAMLYVAMSRCRTLEGLRLVGTPERFVKQCNADPRTLPWL